MKKNIWIWVSIVLASTERSSAGGSSHKRYPGSGPDSWWSCSPDRYCRHGPARGYTGAGWCTGHRRRSGTQLPAPWA